MTISFIIPAYNAANYLEDCLDSVYNLDMQGHDREVIVIDDGSTDNTALLLERFQRKHSDLIVIKQQNEGPSSARNKGIDNAHGTYVCFVDADDRVLQMPVNLLTLLAEEEAEIIGINVMLRKEGKEPQPYGARLPDTNIVSPACEFLRNRNIKGCTWAYIYKREMLKREHISFKTGLYNEDEDFTLNAFIHAKTFRAVSDYIYEYIERPDSLTTTRNPESNRQRVNDLIRIIETYDSVSIADARARECIECKLNYLAVDTLRLLSSKGFDKQFKKETIGKLRATRRFPLRWNWNWKYVIFNIYTRIAFAL